MRRYQLQDYYLDEFFDMVYGKGKVDPGFQDLVHRGLEVGIIGATIMGASSALGASASILTGIYSLLGIGCAAVRFPSPAHPMPQNTNARHLHARDERERESMRASVQAVSGSGRALIDDHFFWFGCEIRAPPVLDGSVYVVGVVFGPSVVKACVFIASGELRASGASLPASMRLRVRFWLVHTHLPWTIHGF